MSNITIGWDNATPGDNDLVGQGDDVIRSLKSNLQGALDAEHVFPSAGGAAGAHRRGSARVFVGPASEVSSADTDGRLMWNSGASTLLYAGSEGLGAIGGAGALILGGSSANLSVDSTKRVAVSIQSQNITGSATLNFTFDSRPYVLLTANEPQGVNRPPAVVTMTNYDTTFKQATIGVYDVRSQSQSTLSYDVVVLAVGPVSITS